MAVVLSLRAKLFDKAIEQAWPKYLAAIEPFGCSKSDAKALVNIGAVGFVPPDEFEHESEWDSEDSDAYQDRVEAGLETGD